MHERKYAESYIHHGVLYSLMNRATPTAENISQISAGYTEGGATECLKIRLT